MPISRRSTISEIMAILEALPGVNNVKLYGSHASGTADGMSDIDIELDVSGQDEGEFMLALPEMLKGKLEVLYVDYAPSLAPGKYVATMAFDENDPFALLDVCCEATPHVGSVSRDVLREKNDVVTHTLKLWPTNLKHYLRGTDCHGDIMRMAGRVGVNRGDDIDMLGETLAWLEANVPQRLRQLTKACRSVFDANG